MNTEYDFNQTMRCFKILSFFRQDPNYYIAENMEYLAREGCDLSERDLFTLAVKVQEAAYTSTEPLLHHERLDAVRYLLEYGIREDRFDFLPTLTAEQAKAFLLSADEYDVCTLVDMVASDNRDHYASDNAYSISKQQDGQRLFKALEQAANQKTPLLAQIQDATARTETIGKSTEKELEL